MLNAAADFVYFLQKNDSSASPFFVFKGLDFLKVV
jgi:hypothetical protein